MREEIKNIGLNTAEAKVRLEQYGLNLLSHNQKKTVFSMAFDVIAITLVQQHKTQRALESLRDLSAPRALVTRDGEEIHISGQDVVPSDLLVLHEGDRVPADAKLVNGQLWVDESLLTGESVPIIKLADKTASLFSSTVVTNGCGQAVVEKTEQRRKLAKKSALF